MPSPPTSPAAKSETRRGKFVALPEYPGGEPADERIDQRKNENRDQRHPEHRGQILVSRFHALSTFWWKLWFLPVLFPENEQSPQFYGQAIVNNSKTKGHAGVTPRGLQRDCPPRPSRDSVSRRIMCRQACLSIPPANYPQFRRTSIGRGPACGFTRTCDQRSLTGSAPSTFLHR